MAKTKRRGGVADNSENLVYLNRSELEKYYAGLKKKLDSIDKKEPKYDIIEIPFVVENFD